MITGMQTGDSMISFIELMILMVSDSHKCLCWPFPITLYESPCDNVNVCGLYYRLVRVLCAVIMYFGAVWRRTSR
jgi:hypothetical protein